MSEVPFVRRLICVCLAGGRDPGPVVGAPSPGACLGRGPAPRAARSALARAPAGSPALALDPTLARALADLTSAPPPDRGLVQGKLTRRGSCHKRQKPQAPTPQAPVVTAKREKSQTPKVLTAILTLPNLT